MNGVNEAEINSVARIPKSGPLRAYTSGQERTDLRPKWKKEGLICSSTGSHRDTGNGNC